VKALALLLSFLACAAPAFGARGDDPRSIPLVDQSGQTLNLDALRGHQVVITFVATRCSDACPISTAMFSRLNARLRSVKQPATLLEITLDPDYDSPFVMERYAQSYGASGSNWRFVSGSPHNVRALMHAFGVTSEKIRGIPEIHSSFVYLLDEQGKLKRTLLLSIGAVDDIVRALK
jgi:protein SCO1/2